jgi:hypothetical protein
MSTWIATMFHQGGASMYSILYLGVPALGLALFHAIWPRRWSWWAAAGLAALVLGIGVMGWRESVSRMDEFFERESKDPDSSFSATERELMRERGSMEARRPLQFASLVAGACALPLLLGELRRRRRKST